jgi:hypothetical protein
LEERVASIFMAKEQAKQETSVKQGFTTRSYIPEDGTLQMSFFFFLLISLLLLTDSSLLFVLSVYLFY